MKFEKLDTACLEEFALLWNKNLDFDYRITEEMLNKKLFDDPDMFSCGSLICRDGEKVVAFIASKLSDNKLPEYINTGWISLLVVDHEYRGRGIGSKLYHMVESEFIKAGVSEIIIGGEMHNFLSGIPQPDEASIGFFNKLGFILNDSVHYDLINDLSKTDFTALKTRINTDPDYRTVSAQNKDALPLSAFLNTEFPGRWKFEVMECLNKDPRHILLFFNKDEVKGFCRIRMGEDTDGIETYMGENCAGLGPIGIAKDIRGTGLGKRILCDSLKYLQELGAHKTDIDWTILKEYYGGFGFVPWRTYLSAYKTLN